MKLFIALMLAAPLIVHAETVQNMTDAKISAIVMEANDADITASKLARMKSTNPDVKNFAAEMIEDHNKSNHELQAAMEKADVKSRVNKESKEIVADKKATKSNLKSLSGVEFDKAYAQEEVDMHTKVLNTLDQELLPNVKSPNLRSYLTKTRATIAEHLEHAKNLQTKVNM